jgi:phage terminase small subunit
LQLLSSIKMPASKQHTEKPVKEWKPSTRQKIFADKMLEYERMDKPDWVRAYKIAYQIDNTKVALANSSRLLHNAKFADYVNYRREINSVKSDCSPERIKRELARIAFFDPRKLFDDDGNLKPIKNLDDDTAAVIAGCDVFTTYKKAVNAEEGDVKESLVAEVLRKLKFVDKKGALDSLARINGMFIDKSELKVTQTNIVQFDPSRLTEEQLRQVKAAFEAARIKQLPEAERAEIPK